MSLALPPALLATAAAADRPDAELALFRLHIENGDTQARATLIERFLPLAHRLARRYARPGEGLDDLYQVACIGLVKAIDRFDPDREVAFSSYAVPTILGELKRHFRDRTWAVRVPRDLQELTLRVERKVAALVGELHRQPTVAELAEALGTGEEQVLQALDASAAARAMSLSMPRSDEDGAGATLGDTVPTAEEGFDRAEERAILTRLLCDLTPRERVVLRLRFEEDLTQAEIGETIGVSQMQVSRIIRGAIARLRLLAGDAGA